MDSCLITLLAKPERAEGFIIGGKTPITLTAYRCMYERIGKKINLHEATAHIFRHSYLTLLAIAGVNPKTIQLIAGHGDIKITMNRYVHGNDSELHLAGKKFASLVATSPEIQSLMLDSEKYSELLEVS